ncbi:hypothetical protein OIV83_004540 [Microbotryomycetes sp. JL201]|nr:hypothetical protein OIV83_004540 [Microbotryomycetes sp. JL201]
MSSPETTSTPPPMLDSTESLKPETSTASRSERQLPKFELEDLLDQHFGDWRDDLRRDGYCVVNVLSPEKAAQYKDRAFSWLESFGRGFDRNDPKTYGPENLPLHVRGGMYSGNGYGFGQTQWVWDIRCEPAVRQAFAKIWGTDELVVSFDGGSLMMPGVPPPTEDSSWQHIDQSPHRRKFFCVQGIMNLNENGPRDGGLQVMKGSSRLMDKFFDLHGRPPVNWERVDFHPFSNADKQWFLDQGCEWIKVDAKAGDLILWDSACMHQNEPPQGDRARMVTYVCMAPARLLSEEDKTRRKFAFENLMGSTHAPIQGFYTMPMESLLERIPKLKNDPEVLIPREPRRVTEEVLKLAGLQEY